MKKYEANLYESVGLTTKKSQRIQIQNKNYQKTEKINRKSQ
jgi:hypothetical protein